LRLRAAALCAALGVGLLVDGCGASPDWRELQPPGLQLRLTMPCRPDAAARRLALAGAEVELALYACDAGGATFALASAELGDAARVGVALAELARAAQANIGGRVEHEVAAAVSGMTPQPAARRLRLTGTLPGGGAVVEELTVFAYGSRVYQATVVGARPDAAAVQTFFDGLRVVP
jgi:hypothetical protein